VPNVRARNECNQTKVREPPSGFTCHVWRGLQTRKLSGPRRPPSAAATKQFYWLRMSPRCAPQSEPPCRAWVIAQSKRHRQSKRSKSGTGTAAKFNWCSPITNCVFTAPFNAATVGSRNRTVFHFLFAPRFIGTTFSNFSFGFRLLRGFTSEYPGKAKEQTHNPHGVASLNLANELLGEAFSGGILNGLAVTNSYDADLRRTTLSALSGSSQPAL